MKKALFALLLAGASVSFFSPAQAYVVLVLHPADYVYSENGTEPQINALAGTDFTLYLSIATDQNISVGGVDAILSFVSSSVTVSQEISPVDESVSDPTFIWDGIFGVNRASNSERILTYEQAAMLGESIDLGPGQYVLGSIMWYSRSSVEYKITVEATSDLMDADDPVNLLTIYRGCTINPQSLPDGGDTDTGGTSNPSGGGGGSGSGGTEAANAVTTSCFIATAAWGSPDAEEVQVLRKFRDRYLLTTGRGRDLVALYYRLSPPLAKRIAGDERLKLAVRIVLKPLVWFIRMNLH